MELKGYYARLGWFGDIYVAVNGKANKLAKLIKEQKKEEKQTLKLGTSWNLGERYSLTVDAHDTQTSPRQAWLSLSKDGKTFDNKVVNEGEVYTYVEKSLKGEADVLEVKAGDKFGVFEVKEANENYPSAAKTPDTSLIPKQWTWAVFAIVGKCSGEACEITLRLA